MAFDHKQKERQQRGEDFQSEIRRSWRLLANVWRLRVKDGGGSSNAGDELILLNDINVLAEHKRTAGYTFQLGFLRPSQLKGLVDFDRVISRNYGLVFVSFYNEDIGLDKAYAFRLVTALRYLQAKGSKTIHLNEFERGDMPAIELPRLPGIIDKTYDLKGVQECYKSL